MRAIGDPGISEWGNPPARVSPSESIGRRGKPGELKLMSASVVSGRGLKAAVGPTLDVAWNKVVTEFGDFFLP